MKAILTMLALPLIASGVFTLAVLAAQPESILGKTDIHALLEAAPGMASSTTEAATRAYGPDIRMYDMPVKLDSLYDPFFKRTASAHELLKAGITARAKGMPDQATMEKQAKAQANANPIVAGMGGLDKVQQMDPAQRQQAAKEAAEQYKQSLVTGGGRNSAGMQAMMQKVMNDPEYRARFQKMSDQEKEAELRKYMGNAPPITQTPAEQQQAQQRLQAKNEVSGAMGIQNELGQMVQRLGEIDATFAQKDQAISAAPGSHDQIAREISAKIEKVPIVELGEYGHDHDPAQVTALLREQATRDRDRAAQELKERTALHIQRKAQYEQLVSAYQVWLKQNQGRINTSMADPLHNTNTELAVAGYERCVDRLVRDSREIHRGSDQRHCPLRKGVPGKMSNRSAARSSRPTKTKN